MLRRNAPLVIFAALCLASAAGCANPIASARLVCAGADRTLAAARLGLADYTESYQEALAREAEADPSKVAEIKAKRDDFREKRAKVRLAIASAHLAVGAAESVIGLVETGLKDLSSLGAAIGPMIKAVEEVVRLAKELTGGKP